jgi:hypothetical protein
MDYQLPQSNDYVISDCGADWGVPKEDLRGCLNWHGRALFHPQKSPGYRPAHFQHRAFLDAALHAKFSFGAHPIVSTYYPNESMAVKKFTLNHLKQHFMI